MLFCIPDSGKDRARHGSVSRRGPRGHVQARSSLHRICLPCAEPVWVSGAPPPPGRGQPAALTAVLGTETQSVEVEEKHPSPWATIPGTWGPGGTSQE